MVPSYFMLLERFPLTGNQKIDFEKLPKPQPKLHELTLPENELEEKVQSIWSTLLNIPASEISTTIPFFAIGGNSLLTAKFLAVVHLTISSNVSFQEFLRNQTIKQFTTLLKSQSGSKMQNSHDLQQAPASYSQMRIFLDSQMSNNPKRYNIGSGYRITGALDKTKLRKSLESVINRQEILRTTYVVDQVLGVKQIVLSFDKSLEQIVWEEFTQNELSEAKLLKRANELLFIPFDLTKDLPIRCYLFS